MDTASATMLGQTPTIEIRPAAKATASASDTTNTRPDFWHRTFGKDGFSFSTILDIVNPLQHIPIVSTIYQKLTGDIASPGAHIIGGALFGGPIGFAVASADTALKSETGKDMGGHVFALFDSAPTTPTATMLADTKPSAGAPTIAADQTALPQILADAPRLKAPTEIAQPKIALKDTHLAAASPAPVGKTTTPYAFAMNNRRTPANGVGGSFVALESRANVTPAAWYSPAATLASDPIANAAKPVANKVSFTPPDLKALAGNPDQLNQLRLNGMRAHPAKPTTNPQKPAASDPSAMPGAAVSSTGATPSSLDLTASDGANTANTTSSDDGSSDGYAGLMARNLARYMALQNKRPAPAQVNQAY
jgi:hypothetical protein